MIPDLSSRSKSVGAKQSRKVIREGQAEVCYLALDAEERVREPIIALCRECGVPVEDADTMAELGKVAGIEVGAAVVAVLRT